MIETQQASNQARRLAAVHHISVDVVMLLRRVGSKHVVARAKVTLVDGSTRAAPSLYPLAAGTKQDILSRRALIWIRMQHRLDDTVHRVQVEALSHELRCASKFLFVAGDWYHRNRRHRVDIGIGHEKAVHGVARAFWNRVAVAVAAESAALGAPGQAGKNAVGFARAEFLPVKTVLGDDTVASDLSKHHAKSEDIGGLVEAARKSLGREVVAVTLSVNVLRCRPRAGKTKVGDLKTTLKVDEDIGWLEIQVDVAGLVDECETLGRR